MLPRLHGEFRQLCLEIIASRAPDMDDIFTEMKTKGLVDILTHRSANISLMMYLSVNMYSLHVQIEPPS